MNQKQVVEAVDKTFFEILFDYLAHDLENSSIKNLIELAYKK